MTADPADGAELMLGWTERDALRLTVEPGEVHNFSRARRAVWHEGATSGLTQAVVGIRIADDQDAVWLRVKVDGSAASCHVGDRSCLYRAMPIELAAGGSLRITEHQRRFDPVAVSGDAPNLTIP